MHSQYPPSKTEKQFFAAFEELERGLPSVSVEVLRELIEFWGNKSWSAKEEYLTGIIQHAWEAQGTILECGSGLSSLILGLLARHTGQRLVCLEHDADWAFVIRNSLAQADLSFVELLHTPLESFDTYDWYSVPDGTFTPREVSLTICDGPPEGTRGCRYGMLPVMLPNLSPGAVVLLDDVQSGGASVLARWKKDFGLDSTVEGSIKTYGRTLIP